MKWKQFLRNNGRWSLSHLCDEHNSTACGWQYEDGEFTEVRVSDVPDLARCGQCEGVPVDPEYPEARSSYIGIRGENPKTEDPTE